MKTKIQVKVTRLLFVASVLAGMVTGAGFAAAGQVTRQGNVTSITPTASEASQSVDIVHAKPMPLPKALPAVGPFEGGISTQSLGTPKRVPGEIGTGKTMPDANVAQTDVAIETSSPNGAIIPEEYGTAGIPFTTSRVDLTSANNESKSYPYRAAGKLYFKEGTDSYVCSASLIARGLIVTAAHCVANFGQSQAYSGWQFGPGMSLTASNHLTYPYGLWKVSGVYLISSYYDGTDSCSQWGVVCTDDVAILAVTPVQKRLPGTATGWFSYGYDGWGFTAQNIVAISQLGYPVSHDSGYKMQRTDSQGYVSGSSSNNTVWGTRQTGGSSGGPELVNLGVAANLDGTTDYGTYPDFNTVVGVTSWGSTDPTVKQQGAAPFTSSNIVELVNAACNDYPANCN